MKAVRDWEERNDSCSMYSSSELDRSATSSVDLEELNASALRRVEEKRRRKLSQAQQLLDDRLHQKFSSVHEQARDFPQTLRGGGGGGRSAERHSDRSPSPDRRCGSYSHHQHQQPHPHHGSSASSASSHQPRRSSTTTTCTAHTRSSRSPGRGADAVHKQPRSSAEENDALRRQVKLLEDRMELRYQSEMSMYKQHHALKDRLELAVRREKASKFQLGKMKDSLVETERESRADLIEAKATVLRLQAEVEQLTEMHSSLAAAAAQQQQEAEAAEAAAVQFGRVADRIVDAASQFQEAGARALSRLRADGAGVDAAALQAALDATQILDSTATAVAAAAGAAARQDQDQGQGQGRAAAAAAAAAPPRRSQGVTLVEMLRLEAAVGRLFSLPQRLAAAQCEAEALAREASGAGALQVGAL